MTWYVTEHLRSLLSCVVVVPRALAIATISCCLFHRTADQTGICYRDVCKEELFFPLTKAYQGEPREKTLALSLFLIFLALVTFAVTKPWG